MLRGESPGFSRVAAGNLGFFSIYDGDLRDPLMGPKERSLHSSCKAPSRIPLQEPRSSFGVEARTSGFLSSADMDLGVPLEFPQLSQLRLVWRCKSTYFSSLKSSVRLLVELNRDQWLSLESTELSHMLSCFESILRVTVEYCRGVRCIWSALGHRGLLKCWHNPWRFSRVSS